MKTLDEEKDTEFLRKPSGVFVLDGNEAAHTVQCCHHGGHFLSKRGSGIRRGYCPNCKAITCGSPSCDVCIPFEERLAIHERHERGENPLDYTRYKDELKTLLSKKLPLL